MKKLATIAATVAALVAVPVAAADCTLASVTAGPFDVAVAGGVTAHADAVATHVDLSGLLGTVLCPILGGTGTPAPLG